MQSVTDKFVIVLLVMIASLIDDVPLTVKSTTDKEVKANAPVNVKLSIVAFSTDKLLTHKLSTQLATIKSVTDKVSTVILVIERLLNTKLSILASTADKLLTQRLSIQLATTKSVTERVPLIVTFFLNFADLPTFNLPRVCKPCFVSMC